MVNRKEKIKDKTAFSNEASFMVAAFKNIEEMEKAIKK